VVVIDAPAGFGKSTVLDEWSEADSRPFARLTLARHHDDPVALTESIAGAVAEHAAVDDDVYSALHGSSRGTLKVSVPRLLDSLEASEVPLVVALDDVHTLSDPDSLAVVAALASGRSGGWQLALASRTEPLIRLSRLRASGAVLELTARDLAMDGAGAAALFRACGLRLQRESIELLLERTQGWPAALYLAALSLQGVDEPDAAARTFAGDDRLVADYLRDELLSSLPAETLDFLTRTSILDEVSGELCDAVLATEGSAATLRALARGNALVSALDGKDQRFRYHALLRQMLESELHALHPRAEAELHARASRWYAERGDIDHAVPHAIDSGDVAVAGDLIWSITGEYESAGRGASIRRWLESFTDAQLHDSAPLCLASAAVHVTDGDGAQAEHWVSAAFTALGRVPPPRNAELEVAAKLLRATAVPREGVVRMGEDVAMIADLLPDPRWGSLGCLIRGVALHLAGDLEGARPLLEEGARLGVSAAPNVGTLCRAQLSLIALEEGDVDGSRLLTERAVEVVDRYGLREHPPQALVRGVSALVHARVGESRLATRELKLAERLLDMLIEFTPWFVAETRIVLARTLLMLDDVPGSREQLSAAGPALHRVSDAVVLKSWFQRTWDDGDTARSVTGRWPLTPAELRLLHYLPTHLTFREIAQELFVSTNTVKTQARSIYRKLDVSGRAEAVACARSAGLLGAERER
jgi:LuxR family maltose regulon positive regulatory protein